jgi:hypothetical protein
VGREKVYISIPLNPGSTFLHKREHLNSDWMNPKSYFKHIRSGMASTGETGSQDLETSTTISSPAGGRFIDHSQRPRVPDPLEESTSSLFDIVIVQRKRMSLLSIGERTRPSHILLSFSHPQALILPIARWRFQRTSGALYRRGNPIAACIRSQIK